MVRVQYIGDDASWSIRIGSQTYEIRHWETIDIPVHHVATQLMSPKFLKRTFVEEDREWMANDCPENLRISICKFHGYSDWHQAMDAFFGGSESRKASKLLKKVAPKKPVKQEKLIIEPTKKVEEKIEEKEEPKLEPLPPKLDKLTVPKLKVLLEERGLSTEGKKADLIKTLLEAE